MENNMTYRSVKWILLVSLMMLSIGLWKQQRYEQMLRQTPEPIDTIVQDTTPTYMSPKELAKWLNNNTHITKQYDAKDRIPYAHLFRQYADTAGVSWELLAAICYRESKFNPMAHSHRGASGLMQIMPKIAEMAEIDNPLDPEQNIYASAKFIQRLNHLYRFIGSKKEKEKFMLAAYNAGPAHIADARVLAKREGVNPNVWFEHVEYYLYLLQDSTIATDTLVKYGQFNPMQTLTYVRQVTKQYNQFYNMNETSPIDDSDTLNADILQDSVTIELEDTIIKTQEDSLIEELTL